MPAPAHPSISFSLMKPFALSARRTPTPPRRMRLPLSVRLVAPDSSVSRPLMATPSWQRGTPVLTPTPALTLTLTPTLTLTLTLTSGRAACGMSMARASRRSPTLPSPPRCAPR